MSFEKIKIVVDTNVLLDNPEILLDERYDYSISYTTLQELDKLKSDKDLNFPARHSIKLIFELLKENKISILNVPTEGITNDEKIVEDTRSINAKLMSYDIGALVVAKSKGVEIFDLNSIDKDYDRTYKGYYEIIISENSYYRLTQNEYSIEVIENMLKENNVNLDIPLNCYIILYPFKSENIVNYLCFRKKEEHYKLIPQSTKHLRSAGIGIDFLHPEQLVAFDCVFDDETPLAVISGKIGASKTLMSICGALARTVGHKNKKIYDKILVTRPNVPINKNFSLGFMPGTLEEKMSGWLAPIKTNLQFLFETTQKDRENEEATKIYEEYFQAIPIESIQGASYHEKILIVDESQLLDINTLRQIMSRVATGSKLVLILDVTQTYGANRGFEGFKKLLPSCKGNKFISFIELQHIQRSELTKLVDEIFK